MCHEHDAQKDADAAPESLECYCVVTGGLNEYIWQAWAYLEAKHNNVSQARKVCILSSLVDQAFVFYCLLTKASRTYEV